jgi:anaerobic dimethyl sulfoxide reductase subunit B (iron-sulfur subunit)
MQKCNLCLDRGAGAGAGATSKNKQEDPLEPACVDECVGEALHAGPISELMDKASDAAAERFEQNPTSVIVEPAADEAAAAAAKQRIVTPTNPGD